MSDNKKYYYLKLKDNFYDSDEIKVLENMENGYKYTTLLLKLYLRSLKNDGVLRLNEYIPYDSKMIAAVTGMDLDTVQVAMGIFEKLKLIEILEDGTIFLLNIQNYIGESSTEADRIRAYRTTIAQKKGLLLEGNVPEITNVVQMYDERTPEIELEIEKEKESFPPNSDEYGLSEFLFHFIRENNPNAKEPKLQTWAKEFDLMFRIDNRKPDDVKSVIAWCQNDDFWKTNVLSPAKLRKQYDQLYIKMKAELDKQATTKKVRKSYDPLD